MQKNELIRIEDNIYRVLDIKDDKVLIINCLKHTMPIWDVIDNYESCSEEYLISMTDVRIFDIEAATTFIRKKVRERYQLIAPILPFVGDATMRKAVIQYLADENNISKQSIRHYLCLYLSYQNISVLAPKERKERQLTEDEKNIRWALNKFYYTRFKSSLKTAYINMLKLKYSDSEGQLIERYPSFTQFTYFYRKNKSIRKQIISREGIKNYQENYRPLLGDGVQQFAPTIGYAMYDSTLCDFFLINDDCDLIGRPILTACVDAYSSLCLGYGIGIEGGVYSLKDMFVCMLSDKQEMCRKHGIIINKEAWDCSQLPSVFITDQGREYISTNFEQLTELGVKVINLPSYRAELKGPIEKFFDLVQTEYQKVLINKGTIHTDYKKRGAHDYRLDSCLTLTDFEKVILHCIIYYNTKRIIESFPYTTEMLDAGVKPFANEIWNYNKAKYPDNLISVDTSNVLLTLLPRTKGRFARNGLKVNGLRYKNENFSERYLAGGEVDVAYDADDVNSVWLIERGSYVKFDLIEIRFDSKALDEVFDMKQQQKQIISDSVHESLQGSIDLNKHLTVIKDGVAHNVVAKMSINQSTQSRQKERARIHKNYEEEKRR